MSLSPESANDDARFSVDNPSVGSDASHDTDNKHDSGINSGTDDAVHQSASATTDESTAISESNDAQESRNSGKCESGLRYDERREHFIPLCKHELVRQLTERLPDNEQDRRCFKDMCRLLESVFHFESHEVLRSLKQDYAPLDPDLALVNLHDIDDTERDRRADSFLDSLTRLLQRANYRELSRDEIDEAIRAASAMGIRLRVNFELFDRLHVFVRGEMLDSKTVWGLFTRFRKRTIDVPIYQRLVVMFRLNDSSRPAGNVTNEHVFLKIFKNIPRSDLDMLLPGTKVKMTLLDQGRIILPTLSGIAISVVKLAKAVTVLFVGGIFGIIIFVGLVGGTLGYGLKSFFGYLRTKDKYQLNLTRHLYFQNLDNNAGVFFRVLNEANEQEFREAIVAYFVLLQQDNPDGMTKRRLDRTAESLISDMIKVDVDFEDDDALAKLERLGIAKKDDQDRWTCVSIANALKRLDEAWDNYFQYHKRH